MSEPIPVTITLETYREDGRRVGSQILLSPVELENLTYSELGVKVAKAWHALRQYMKETENG